ncbi:MAG: [FeFe] hydrogenase H-cluster radical SAM maturase HydG, partial [Rikenellaceae bacterium]|nr:[FeFe] hydrogenase H-cluster radical SAM maturase HydG [Rikenellaceae bacterium]
MFTPQIYSIPDRQGEPFIDPAEIRSILESSVPEPESLTRVIRKSLSLQRLSLRETALLLNASPQQRKQVVEAAGKLKRRIYGDRIVIFAPLYIGNKCVNDCTYCGFRASNGSSVRRTLRPEEIGCEVAHLSSRGQRRLILVFGEHPLYDPGFIAETVRIVYLTRRESGYINRVNINAAPLDTEGFRTVKEAGIGTYQIFQETYDPHIYGKVHGRGPKSDYDYRLTALDRAMKAGIDDVGLGALFGLGDWKFDVMALVRHTNHLEACFGVGPHTISFPRIKAASNMDPLGHREVSDEDFKYLVAVLRLAVPYAGSILTAREPHDLRNELIRCGVSQIDAGTNLEIGGYSGNGNMQELNREQFLLSDTRSLLQTVEELIRGGNIPSFCTACYRKGRTGEHFMQFATDGHIKEFCTPNALLTFAEYLCDHTGGGLQQMGWELIKSKMDDIESKVMKSRTERALEAIRCGKRE